MIVFTNTKNYQLLKIIQRISTSEIYKILIENSRQVIFCPEEP